MLRKLGVVATVLLVSGCAHRVAGPDAPPREPDGPTRDQVLLADGLCVATEQLNSNVAQGEDVLATQPDPTEPAFFSDSYSYLRSFSGSTIEYLATAVAELPRSGIEAADAYAAGLAAELTRIAPDITNLAGDDPWDAEQLSEEQRRDRVGQVVGKLESVDPDGPDLRTLARQDREFAEAYVLAPNCAPLAPASTAPTSSRQNVPEEEAADGTDLSACGDGTCEVAITGTVQVTAGSFTLTVIVSGDEVRVARNTGGGGSGQSTMTSVGSTTTFGDTDQEVTITVNGLHGDTAVLDFSTA